MGLDPSSTCMYHRATRTSPPLVPFLPVLLLLLLLLQSDETISAPGTDAMDHVSQSVGEVSTGDPTKNDDGHTRKRSVGGTWEQGKGGVVVVENCSVVIAGGSTAALAAAVASAKEGVRTCLLEPTDWPGGQMTSAGVPAIDFNNAKPLTDAQGNILNVSFASHHPKNHAPEFFELLNSIRTTGRCSVSTNCYPPRQMIKAVTALLQRPDIASNLDVYMLAVPVRAIPSSVVPGAIDTMQFVQRRPTNEAACNGWDKHLSQVILDWYSPTPSARFGKRVLEFRARGGADRPVFVDGTEWGELLALLDAPYLQGLSEKYDGDSSGVGGNDQCGQSFSVTLTATLHDKPQHERDKFEPMPEPQYEVNCNSNASCAFIWKRRRLISTDPSGAISAGDMTLFVLQDWRWSYLYKSREDARAEALTGWKGGLNTTVLALAEKEALGWYRWLQQHATYGEYLTLRDNASSSAPSPVGTCTGLMKMPYVRGARRSVGIDGFVLNASSIRWDGDLLPRAPVATPFPDRVAIASFFLDVHEMHEYQPGGKKCYPSYIPSFESYYNDDLVLPFSIPLRALSNQKYDNNFLLAGKTIATSFLVPTPLSSLKTTDQLCIGLLHLLTANQVEYCAEQVSSAVRLHPGEWAVGSAAGAVAATLVKTNSGLASLLRDPLALSHAITVAEQHTPRDWILQCPWGGDANSTGNGWSCIGGKPTPKPSPSPSPSPGFSCKGPTGQERCVQSTAASAMNATCNGQCPSLRSEEWLASIPDNWEVQPERPDTSTSAIFKDASARSCSGWNSTRGFVLHGNDTGAIALPTNVTTADGIARCIQACCADSNCWAWVTGPADGSGRNFKIGDPRCFLKSHNAVASKRWAMNSSCGYRNCQLAAYGIAPAPPPSPSPHSGRALLTAIRETTLKKSEVFSGMLPADEKLAVKKGAVWRGIAQIDEQYWLVMKNSTLSQRR